MNEAALRFFDSQPDALPLYEMLEARILNEIPDVTIKVQKTQISFYNRHLFACVSFAKVRKAKDRPDVYIVVTIGTQTRIDSPRIDVATEPYRRILCTEIKLTRALLLSMSIYQNLNCQKVLSVL